MGKVYGYCRISTKKQNIERQERNILKIYPDAIVIKETYTGTKFQGRKELDKILQKVQAEDTIVFDSVSRMSRTADEGYATYEKLFEQGVNLVFLKEPQINTDTYRQALATANLPVDISTGDSDSDELMQSIITALKKYILSLAKRQIRLAFEQAEKEVQDLHQRTKEGIETARLNGKQIGQQTGRKLNVKKAAAAKEQIQKYNVDFGGQLNNEETWKLIGISKMTFYKYKKELLESMLENQATL